MTGPDAGAVTATLAASVAAHRSGRLDAAEAGYRAILTDHPDQPDANHNLGTLCVQRGAPAAGLPYLRRAVRNQPTRGQYWLSLSQALLAAGRAQEALGTLDQARAKGLRSSAAATLRARVLAALGRAAASTGTDAPHAPDPVSEPTEPMAGTEVSEVSEAPEASESSAPERAPAAALSAALADYQAKRFAEAAAAAHAVVAACPGDASAWHLLGLALRGLGQARAAVDALRQASALDPSDATVHSNLGNALKAVGAAEAARAAYQQAVALDGANPTVLSNLGALLTDLEQPEAAEPILQRAVALAPDSADAHYNLGLALAASNRLDAAEAALRRSLLLGPDRPEALNTLGTVLKDLGRIKDAQAAYRQALALRPDYARAHANLILALHYDPDADRPTLRATLADWRTRHVAAVAAPTPAPVRVADPERTLRIGLVSGSFRRHPALSLSLPGLAALDPTRLQLYAYADNRREDSFTHRLRALCRGWRPIADRSDAAVAETVAADGIDLLVDMAGHGAHCRLGVFARRPAPVQVKWVGGLWNSTGLPEIDWLLADAQEVPEADAVWYTERIYRLPDAYTVFQPPDTAPAVTPLPALKRGAVTFGCFNNPAKINDRILALWADILAALPGARLILRGRAFGAASACAALAAGFARRGVDPARLELIGHTSQAALLAGYGAVDLALDPWPYSGGLTTCEALWMGVPVLTWPGPTFAGRHAATYLHALGLGDWIADGPDAYVRQAIERARDSQALATLRAGLRTRMAGSALCDGKRFARNLEAAFRTMWRARLDAS